MKEALEAASKKIVDACEAASADLAPHENEATKGGRNVIRIRRRLAQGRVDHALLRMREGFEALQPVAEEPLEESESL